MFPRKARGSWLFAALLAVAVAGVGVGVYLTRNTQIDAVSLTSYFPEREALTLYINVGAMRTSGILDKLVGTTVGEEQEYREFVQGTGFDYKRDLEQVMLNSAGGIHYFVLQGNFDWDKLRGYATKQGGRCRDEECSVKGSTPDRIVSFRKLRTNLMALASARDDSGSRAVDKRTPEKLPFEVPTAPLWAHVPVDLVRAVPSYPAGTRLFAKALESADRAVFTLAPAQDGFQLAADVDCRTQEDAAILKAQFEGITSLLQKFLKLDKQTPNPGDLSGILSAGSFERSGTKVKARWPIPKAFIESLSGT